MEAHAGACRDSCRGKFFGAGPARTHVVGAEKVSSGAGCHATGAVPASGEDDGGIFGVLQVFFMGFFF